MRSHLRVLSLVGLFACGSSPTAPPSLPSVDYAAIIVDNDMDQTTSANLYADGTLLQTWNLAPRASSPVARLMPGVRYLRVGAFGACSGGFLALDETRTLHAGDTLRVGLQAPGRTC